LKKHLPLLAKGTAVDVPRAAVEEPLRFDIDGRQFVFDPHVNLVYDARHEVHYEALRAPSHPYQRLGQPDHAPTRPGDVEGYIREINQKLVLKVTGKCNLRCTYCVYGDEHAEMADYSDPAMSLDVLRRAADFYVAIRQGKKDPPPRVDLYGGEPTLARDVLLAAVPLFNEALGERVEYFLVTNGTFPDDEELKALIREHEINLLVSIDGPEVEHDRFRRDAAGRGTFDKTFRFLKEFEGYPRLLLNLTLNPGHDLEAIDQFFSELLAKHPGVHLNIGKVKQPQNLEASFDRRAQGRHSMAAKRDRMLDKLRSGVPLTLFEERLLEDGRAALGLRYSLDRTESGHGYNCFPGHVLMVDSLADLYVCQSVSKQHRIGTLADGLDGERILRYWQEQNRRIDQLGCASCVAESNCSNCFAVRGDVASPETHARMCGDQIGSFRAELEYFTAVALLRGGPTWLSRPPTFYGPLQAVAAQGLVP
jgi:uncharacterized protein